MKRAGENNFDLADALGLESSSTITRYLHEPNGPSDKKLRYPSEEILTKIAIHYRTTKKMLVNFDCEKIYVSLDDNKNKSPMVAFFRLPTADISDKLLNENNKKVISIFSGETNEQLPDDFIDKVHIGLKKKYEYTKDLNYLIWVVWYELLDEAIISLGIHDDNETENQKKAKVFDTSDGINNKYVDECEESPYNKFKFFKDTKWFDLIQYYSALRFIYGYGNTSLDIETNQIVGGSMMEELKNFGNKYALELPDYTKTIIEGMKNK